MKSTGKFLVGGNWKCNGTLDSVSKLISELNSAKIPDDIEVVVAPTFVHLQLAVDKLSPRYQVSAQNCWVGKQGAYTGEIAAEQLVDMRVRWVILGHSERRSIFGESSEFVGDKVATALQNGLKVIACIGETLEQREGGQMFAVLEGQLKGVADRIPDWQKVVIAYEPVWAIGTGKVASPAQAQEVHAFIRKWLAESVSPDVSGATRILYGGSVNDKNSSDLAGMEDIDGFLVGGASLKGASFATICNAKACRGSPPRQPRRTSRAAPQPAPVSFGFKTEVKLGQAGQSAFLSRVAAQAATGTVGAKQVTECKGKKLNVAINGFGRIGRNFLRCVVGRKDSNLNITVINDSGGVKQASHLLKYDSTLGTFNADVQMVDESHITVNGKSIRIVSSRDPLQLPWKEENIDLVIEGTGVFLDRPGAGKHLQAGAKKVLITAPAKGSDIPTYVCGVNAHEYKHSDDIVSNASCTTNCLAPFAKVLDEKFGIVKGTMTTTHSYTGDQRLLDASHRDLRRARAAALNIVPTSTGAAKAVALVLPKLKGKLNGIALRVPTPNVSVVDLVIQVEKKTFAEEVNSAFREAAAGAQKGVLAVSDLPLVSRDFALSDVSTTIDASLTMVMGDDMVKVVAWYDNEWGYSQRVVDLAEICAANWE
ncbi:hypothetical protein WJX81_008567 [Elliptochloris bilobata]|uniref:Glyceraldehyde-3-phosphate dehydrogenase A, chloroplastic n=1 Tax=Elliptochloris bilobata TaxID=381761 RepID=A0AAW1R041_9CHLO